MHKVRIVYTELSGQSPRVVECANFGLDGEWFVFTDDNGVILQLRAADVATLERES